MLSDVILFYNLVFPQENILQYIPIETPPF